MRPRLDQQDTVDRIQEHLVKSVNKGQLVVLDAFGCVRQVPDLVVVGVEDVLQNLNPGEAVGHRHRPQAFGNCERAELGVLPVVEEDHRLHRKLRISGVQQALDHLQRR